MPSQQAIKAGEVFVEAFLKDVQFQAGLDRMRSRMKQVTTDLRELSMVGVGMGVALFPIVSTFVKFDDAILTLEAVTEGSREEMDRLTESAKTLGQTTSFSASEVAKLMIELGKAGFTRVQIDNMTKSVLDLARATGTDATLAATYLSSTLRQFGLDSTQAQRVADALGVTANKSSVSVEDLGVSLSYAGSLAHTAGMSLEQTLAILGVLGDFTVKGDMAGTSLRRMIAVITSGGKEIKKIFGGDIEVSDPSGKLRNVVDVMKDIEESTKSLTQEERLTKFKQFFELLGINSASIVARGTGAIKEFEETLAGKDGKMAAAAAKMDSQVGGAFRRVKAGAESVAIALGNALAPALTAGALILSKLGTAINEWIERNKELASQIGLVVMAVLGLIATGMGLYVLSIAFGGIAAAIGLCVGLIKLMLAGVMLLFTPIGFVVGLFALMVANAESVEEAVGMVFAAIAIPIFAAVVVVKGLIAVFTALRDAIRSIDIGDMGDFGKGIEEIRRRFTAAGTAIIETANEVKAIFGEMFTGIKDAIARGDIATAGKIAMLGLEAAWLSIWAQLLDQWHKFVNNILDAFIPIVAGIREMWFKMWADIVNGVIKFAQSMESFLKGLVVAKVITEQQYNEMAVGLTKAQEAANANAKRDIVGESVKQKTEREAAQNAEVDRIRGNRDVIRDFMNKLAEGVKVGIAPMPREVGPDWGFNSIPLEDVKAKAARVGDSARGVFQSGDYAGSLAIGPANKLAEDSLKKLSSIDGTLKDIKKGMDEGGEWK